LQEMAQALHAHPVDQDPLEEVVLRGWVPCHYSGLGQVAVQTHCVRGFFAVDQMECQEADQVVASARDSYPGPSGHDQREVLLGHHSEASQAGGS
jgi:hypothetical protein